MKSLRNQVMRHDESHHSHDDAREQDILDEVESGAGKDAKAEEARRRAEHRAKVMENLKALKARNAAFARW